MTAVALDNTNVRWFGSNTPAGRAYDEDEWEATFAAAFRNGPWPAIGSSCSVYADSSGMQVKVRVGQVFIQGHDADIGTELVLPVNAYTGTTRLDGVVIRRRTGQAIEFEVLPGIDSTTLPTLTQNSSIWEEFIWSVLVDNNTTIPANKVDGTLGGGDLRILAGAVNGFTSCVSTARPAHARGNVLIERDTQLRMRYDDGTIYRWVPGTGSEVGCDLAMSAGVDLGTSGAWGKVTLETENWDHAALHSGSDAHVAISAAAIWEFNVGIQFAASADTLHGGGASATWADGAGLDRHVGLHVASGAEFTSGSPSHPLLGQQAVHDHTVTTRMGRSKRLDLNVGDWVTLVARQDQGAALLIKSASLSARIVGYNV